MTNLEYYGFNNLEFNDIKKVSPIYHQPYGYVCNIYYKCKHGDPILLTSISTRPLDSSLLEAKVEWLLKEHKSLSPEDNHT